MANLAAVLKAEVVRLARKELRAETEDLLKTVSKQRSEIAALRKRTAELEKAISALTRLANRAQKVRPAVEATDEDEGAVAVSGQFRFRAAGMASNRRRLGLSAEDFGLLVGATGQSVYAWESGRSRPRQVNLAAIASLRGIGKREVASRLAVLKEASPQGSASA